MGTQSKALTKEIMVMMAWLAHADNEASPVELNTIRAYGEAHGIKARWTTALVEGAARGVVRAPDFARLGLAPDKAVEAAETLIAADGILDDGEIAVLKNLKARLRSK